MWKHGTTRLGKVRWYCKNCKRSGIKKRSDVTLRGWKNVVRCWLVEGSKLRLIAKTKKLHPHYVQKKCAEVLERGMTSAHGAILDPQKPLLLDGTWIVWRRLIVLIASDTERVVHWKFVTAENAVTWHTFLSELKGRPLGVVSDAQRGLLQAVTLRFGDIPHQRCLAHIVRLSRLWLTRHPKTEAGIRLLEIVNTLANARTVAAAQEWRGTYQEWLLTHQDFLKERSYLEGTKKWWYTHRRLRGVRSLLVNALPNLFVHIAHDIPNTSNALEGGINGPLKFVFKEHRGLSIEHKKALTALFLSERLKKKNQH